MHFDHFYWLQVKNVLLIAAKKTSHFLINHVQGSFVLESKLEHFDSDAESNRRCGGVDAVSGINPNSVAVHGQIGISRTAKLGLRLQGQVQAKQSYSDLLYLYNANPIDIVPRCSGHSKFK